VRPPATEFVTVALRQLQQRQVNGGLLLLEWSKE
jgi:hypothetical protein